MATDTAPNQDEMQDVQHKLLAMLQSVRLDEGAKPTPPPKPAQSNAVASAPAPANAAPAAPAVRKVTAPGCCSQCGEADAFKTSSWCKACGFYPKLNRTVDVTSKVEEEKKIELDEVIDRVPVWIWSMAGGMILIFFVAILIRLQIPSIVQRGPLGLLFLLGGLTAAGTVHVKAFSLALKTSSSFKLASMFATPVEIWRVVWAQLPGTRKYFYTLAWGLTAVFVGLVVVELDWNGLFKPSEKKAGEQFSIMSWAMKMVGTMAGTVAQVQQSTAGPDGGGASMAADMLSAAQDMQLDNGELPADGNVEDALSNFAGQMTDGALDLEGGGGDGETEGMLGHGALVEQQRQAEEQAELLEEQERLKAEEEAKAAAEAASGQPGTKAEKDPKAGPTVDPEKEPMTSGSSNPDSATGETASTTGTGLPGTGANTVTLGNGNGSSGVGSPSASDMKQGTFLILGYTLSISGDIHSLVLAEVNAGRVRYVDNVPVAGLSEEIISKLREELDAEASAKPFLKVPFRARWTKPAYECTVVYKTKTSAGKLEKAQVKSYARRVATPAPAASKK